MNDRLNMQNSIAKLLDNVIVEWKTLGEVIKSLKTGLNPRNNFKLNTSDAMNFYITVREIQNGKIVFLDKTDKINNQALELINNRSNLEAGDILFSGTGTVGKTAVIDEKPKNWNIKEGVYVIKPVQEIVISKYLSHLFNSQDIVNEYSKKIVGSPVISLPMSELKKIQIPIPPLHIQTEIARILDSFTAFTAELTAELTAESTARKKQYNYYRDQLLTFQEDEVEWKALGEVVNYEQPTKYLVKSTSYSDKFKTPVLTAGKTFILGFTDEIDGIYKASETPVIIFDDFTTANKWVDFNFKVKSSAMKMITSIDESKYLLKYIYYWLNTLSDTRANHNHKRQWISNFANKKVPIPPLKEQARIVEILDKFDALTNSITEGLLREIALRQKQYEYYRNLLLDFPKVQES
ncbi:type I restriction enzyme, S subunit [Apibacter mensalis]|uniref:Type I restriction enzyme, S subunit n=1 Tax=Apibacter mensalis TaxID=1586267 RepID=A0A0X3APC6_9FLAO|nr:restriction endonuclease subunit S [Apibacter mensalis]CVK15905.1 type I restriction enzyme, S subunit [Apibacter mensalis]